MPINLHLYIPGQSAHAPGDRKLIIYSLVQTNWIQNIYTPEFIETAQLLQNNLISQNHEETIPNPLFVGAANQISIDINKPKI